MGEWITVPVSAWSGPGIHPQAIVGHAPELRDGCANPMPVLVHESATIGAYCTIDAGAKRPTQIGARSWCMKGCHLGHDVILGKDVELSPHVVLCGGVEIGDGARIGVNACVLPYVKVGAGARVGAGAVVTKDVPDGETWAGCPAKALVVRGRAFSLLSDGSRVYHDEAEAAARLREAMQ